SSRFGRSPLDPGDRDDMRDRRCVWNVVTTLILLGSLAATARAQAPSAAKKDGRRPFVKAGTPKRTERIRTFDVEHIKAELTLDPNKGLLWGKVTHRIKPLHPYLTAIELDCGPDLKVSKVVVGQTSGGRFVEQKHHGLSIDLDRAFGPGETFDVTISYSGKPERGLFFIGHDDAYPDRPESAWTAGWAEE